MSASEILGGADCNECGGTRSLVISPEYIESKCLACGFSEREWKYGDNPNYLEHLAETFKVDLDRLRASVKARNKNPTEIQRTLLDQLNALNPWFVTVYNVRAILWLEWGNGIRLHTKHGRGAVNIDIVYNAGSDLYDVKAYHVDALKPDLCETIATHEGVNVIELDETINDILKP